MSEIQNEANVFNNSSIKQCKISGCKKLNHSECLAEFKKHESARVLKLYHEKYKFNRYMCECGVSVLESYRKQHEQRKKHINNIKQNTQSLNV
jgi:hypothetical protein